MPSKVTNAPFTVKVTTKCRSIDSVREGTGIILRHNAGNKGDIRYISLFGVILRTLLFMLTCLAAKLTLGVLFRDKNDDIAGFRHEALTEFFNLADSLSNNCLSCF